MASNRNRRKILLATTLSICVQTQLVLPLASNAQGASAEVPTAPTGSPEPPIPAASMPSPSVPDVASIITPDVSAILNQSVPSPTTMVIDFAQNSTLNFSGDFINPANVTLYAISTDPNITTATISAANIYNAGIITTILPSGGLPGYTNLVGNLNLLLNAVNNIVNIGEISSAGNLSLTAGNAIVNVTSNAGVSAIMSAATNVSLTANNMVNSGTISAVNNLNLSSVMVNNLAVNGVGGMFQAGGAINIRDATFTAKSNLDVLGGIWSSPAFNFNSGNGITKMALESATGLVNGSTGELYLSSVATLNLGNVEILGDPSFSSDGDLFLGSVSANEAITAHANGNIFAGSLIADGGAITLQAGGTVSASGSLQSTHSIYIIGSTVSAAGTVMSAGDFIHIGGDVIDVSGASLTAGGSVDFYATTLVANETQITAGDSISVVGSDVGAVSLNEAVIQSGNNFGAGSGQISAIDAAITATGEVYLGTSAGNISAANLQVTAQDSVTIDSLNGGVELSGSIIKSNGGNVFVYGNQSVNLGDVIDTSGPDGGGRIFVASVNGSVNAPGEGFITTGPNPLLPPPGFFEISISAKESLSVGHLTSGGGNVSVQSGSLIERNGGAVLAFVTQEGTGSTSVTEINTAGAFTGRGDVEVFGAEGGVQVGTITGNGLSVLVDSRGSLTLESVNNDILDDRGGYPTITLVANAADPLTIHESLISASGVSGGGLVDITNYGMGGISINADSIAIAATESGAGGALFVTSSSWININGDLIIDGKDVGSGGIVELTALEGDVVVSGKMSANGVGEGMSGGRIVLSSLTGNVTIGGGEVTVNGESGDGGGFAARTFGASGTVTVPSVSANGGGEGAGGSISISGANVASSNLNLDANGSRSGSGGRVWIQLDDSFDASNGVRISAHGGASGNGGNLLLSSGRDLQVDSAKWNISAGANGNGGSVTLQSGLSGEMSQLSIAGAVNVDGNGVGNGGLIEIKVLGEDSDFMVGSGGNATVLSARSGSEGGNGGRIVVTASGDLTATASALRAYTRGDSGDGGYYELRAGASGGGPIGGIVAALEGGAPGPLLTVAGTLNADGAKSGQGGKIIVSASGEGASVDLRAAKLFARGGGISGSGGSVSASATESIELGATNISVSARGGGDGGSMNISASSINFGDEDVQITADGGVVGHGGSVFFTDTGSDSDGGGGGVIAAFARAGALDVNAEEEGRLVISARSKALDSRGGVISFEAPNRDVTIDGGAIAINANGNASNITISAKSLVLGSESKHVNILARATSEEEHPIVTLTAQDGPLTVYGNITATGRDAGRGGQITLNSTGHLSVFGDLLADGGPSGNGGLIELTGSDVIVGTTSKPQNVVARGGAQGGNGGTIKITGNGNVELNTSFLSSSARGGNGNGGKIFVTSSETLSLGGDVTASGQGNGVGGEIYLTFRSPLTIGDGHVFAVAPGTGDGGTIMFVALDPVMDISLNDKVSASSEKGTNGSISFQSPESIKIHGTGALEGKISAASLKETSIELSGKSAIEVESLSSAQGDVIFSSGQVGSVINLKGASVEAAAGTVTLRASKIHNLEDTITAAMGVFLGHGENFELSGSGGSVRVSPSNAQTAGDGIVISGKSVLFSGNGLTLDTSNASGIAKEVRITSASSISNDGAVLNVKADGNGGAIVVVEGTKNVDLGNVLISATSKNGAASQVRISSTGGDVQLFGSIDVSNNGSASGGKIDISGNSVAVTEGEQLSLKATAIENQGGEITVKSIAGNLDLTHISSDVSVTSKGRGGTLNFQALKGTLILAETALLANGTGDGDGGEVMLGGRQFQFTAPTFTVSAKGKNGGTINLSGGDLQLNGTYDVNGQAKGGTITVDSKSVILQQGLDFRSEGTTGGVIVVRSTSGDVQTGLASMSVLGTAEHGELKIYSADNITTGNSLLKHDGDSFQARVIEIAAGTDGSGKLTLNAPLNVIAKGTHIESRIQLNGQVISVDAPLYAKEGSGGTSIKVIANAKPNSSIAISKSIQAEGRLNGSSILIEASTKGSVAFTENAQIKASGFDFAPGGDIKVLANEDLVIPNSIQAQSFSSGDKPGGRITLSSNGALTIRGELDVSGNQNDAHSTAGKITLQGGTKVEFGGARITASSAKGSSDHNGHIIEVLSPNIVFDNDAIVALSGGSIESRIAFLESQADLKVNVRGSAQLSSLGRIILSSNGKINFLSDETSAQSFHINTKGSPSSVSIRVAHPQSTLELGDVSGGIVHITASAITVGKIAATSVAGSITLKAISGESLTVRTQGPRTMTANLVTFSAPAQTVSINEDLSISSFDSNGDGSVLLNADTKIFNVSGKLTSSSLRIHRDGNLTVSAPGRIESLVSLSIDSTKNLAVNRANIQAPELRLAGSMITISESNIAATTPGIHVNASTKIVLGPSVNITAVGGPIQFQVGTVAPSAGTPPVGVTSVGQVIWGQDVVDVRPPFINPGPTIFRVEGGSHPVTFSGPLDSIIFQESLPVFGGGVHITAIAAVEPARKSKNFELRFLPGPVKVWHRGAQFRFASPRNLKIESGELIVDSTKEVTIDTRYGAIRVFPGTTALLKQNGRELHITVLAAKTSRSIEFTCHERRWTASYGERLVLGYREEVPPTDVPFRSSRVQLIDQATCLSLQSSDVSLPAILSQNPLIQSIRRSDLGCPNELVNKVLRTAASLMLVTGHRGPYHRP